MSVTAMMTGARLAYVVRPIEGEVVRVQHAMVAKKVGKDKHGNDRYVNEIKAVEKKAACWFHGLLPTRSCSPLQIDDELKQYNLDQDPVIVNLEGIHDPNSPAGQLLRAQDDKSRRSAFVDLENQVIALATAKTGSVLMPEQVERAA
jgi:hypothetical protein